VHRRPEVAEDIIGLAEYISRDSLETALRFFDAVEATIENLAELPGKGSRRDFEDPRLKDLRSWAVQGFPNHLIFYEATDQTLLIVAVLHGARDLPAALKNRN
jgi:toxin ParE1/3/4